MSERRRPGRVIGASLAVLTATALMGCNPSESGNGSPAPEKAKTPTAADIVHASALMVANTVDCMARDPKIHVTRSSSRGFGNSNFIDGPDGEIGTADDGKTPVVVTVSRLSEIITYSAHISEPEPGNAGSARVSFFVPKLAEGDKFELSQGIADAGAQNSGVAVIDIWGTATQKNNVTQVDGRQKFVTRYPDGELKDVTADIALQQQGDIRAELGVILKIAGVTGCNISASQVPDSRL